MIKLKIRIKAEQTSFTKQEYLPDDYVVSKTNEALFNLVEKAIQESNIEAIEDVIVTATFEW